MKRRTFIKSAAGLFVPTIIGRAAIPSHRRIASPTSSSSGGEPVSPLGDPNIGGFWRSDTDLYDSTAAPGTVRCTTESAPNGWHDQSSNNADWSVNSSCNGPVITASDINGKPSLTFATTANYLGNAKPSPGDIPQPFSIFLLIRLVASPVSYIFDTAGGSGGWGSLYYTTLNGNEIQMSSFLAGPTTSDLALDTWGIISCIFDQASSSIQINNGTVHTGNVGARNYWGLIMGANGGGATLGNFRLAAGIWSMSHTDATWTANHKNWLAWYGGITL